MADYTFAYYKKDAYKHPVGPVQLSNREQIASTALPGVGEFVYLAKLDKNVVIGDFLLAHDDLDTGATGTANVEIDDGGTVLSLFTAASFSIQAAGLQRMTNPDAVGYKVANRNARLRMKIVVAATTPATGYVSFTLFGTNVGVNPA